MYVRQFHRRNFHQGTARGNEKEKKKKNEEETQIICMTRLISVEDEETNRASEMRF